MPWKELERNKTLIEMSKDYPGFFLRGDSGHLLREIQEKYGLHPRKIFRERKVALMAYELALKDGRKKINAEDISTIRADLRENRIDKTISIRRLDRLLRAQDAKLADKVLNILEKELG